jgi:sugar transferase (PEP-CTERM system associated)
MPFMLSRVNRRAATLVLFETVLIVSAVMAAAYIRLGAPAWHLMLSEQGLMKALLVSFVAQICLYYSDLYDLRLVADRRELFVRVIHALSASSFVLAATYFWFPSLIIGRGVFLIAAAFVISVVVGARLAVVWLHDRMKPGERLLIVGTSPAAVALARELFDRRHELGVEIVGFVDTDPALVGTPVINPGVIGTLDDIPSIVRDRRVARVVVSLSDARGKLPMNRLLDMKLAGVAFAHLATVYEEYTGKIAVENLRPSWLIFSEGFRKSAIVSAAKRLLDMVVAGVGLALALPIIVATTLAIKLTSKGPVLYHQERVGLRGHTFTVHKFRSMRTDAEVGTGPVWASKDGDPRVTPVGRFLRRSRIDEIPQLWNVLVGEMSFVGPRPERPGFVAQLTEQIPFYHQRHVVRPGLTGWAQVKYTYGASVEDALQKLQFDLFYIKNLSLSLDLYIIFSTIKTVVLRKGA